MDIFVAWWLTSIITLELLTQEDCWMVGYNFQARLNNNMRPVLKRIQLTTFLTVVTKHLMKVTLGRKIEIESLVHWKAWRQVNKVVNHIISAIRKQEKVDAIIQITWCILFFPAPQSRKGIIYVQICLPTSVKSLWQFLQTFPEVILLDNSWFYRVDHQDKYILYLSPKNMYAKRWGGFSYFVAISRVLKC